MRIINSDGTEEKIIEWTPDYLARVRPDWSNDINKIVTMGVRSATSPYEIIVLNPNGIISDSYVIPDDSNIQRWILNPKWSYDQSLIAYWYWPKGNMIIDLEGDSTSVIDFDYGTQPFWSHNENKLTLFHNHTVVKYDIKKDNFINLFTLNLLDYEYSGVWDVAWSPDEKMIAIACDYNPNSYNKISGILIFDLNGNIVTHLVESGDITSIDWH